MLGERRISDKKIDEWLNDHKFTDVYKTGIIADFINCDPTKTGRLQIQIREEYALWKLEKKKRSFK
jgi:hypothetical protein